MLQEQNSRIEPACADQFRAGSQFRELFQEIVSRGGLDIEELEAIILNLVLDMVSGFSSGSFE